MHSLIFAAILTLSPGYNNAGQPGEVVAVQAATTNAAATVRVKSVDTLTTYTNYDGNASISTNVLKYVDYDYFKTNGVSKIISGPVRFDLPITNTVVTGSVPSAFFVKTNDLATVTTSGHFGSIAVTNKFLFGGGIVVEGAADGGAVKMLIK